MNYAIVLADGNHFVSYGGRPLVSDCLDVIDSSLNTHIVIVVCDDNHREIVGSTTSSGKRILFARSGVTRQLSVLNALISINESFGINDDTVMIYDADEKGITCEFIDMMYEAIKGHDGVLPVMPLEETIYECKADRVIGYLKRDYFFVARSPELFNLKKYYNANMTMGAKEIFSIERPSEPAVKAGMDIVTVPMPLS